MRRWLDPLAAMVLAAYIACKWFATAYDNVRILTGAAPTYNFALDTCPRIVVWSTTRVALARDAQKVCLIGPTIELEIHTRCLGVPTQTDTNFKSESLSKLVPRCRNRRGGAAGSH